MKISIIVPVYNCEGYLHACIDSLINQSYEDIEVILVDDGSSDQSPFICDDYKNKDFRIKVIHKSNCGVSAARNTGLKSCTGEYVTFVDADDWIDENACSKIAKQIDEDCLLYMWNLNKCVGSSVERQLDIRKESSISKMIADIIASPKYQNAYIRASGAKVYSRKLLEDLAFSEKLYIGEDACFLLECMNRIQDVNKIKVINDNWYNYRIIKSSAVRRYKADLLQQSILQYEYISAAVLNMGIESDKSIVTAMTMFCWSVFINLKANSMKGIQNSKDCLKWAELTKKYLRNPDIETEKLSKFPLFCWILYKIMDEAWMEGIVGLYERYKQRKN